MIKKTIISFFTIYVLLNDGGGNITKLSYANLTQDEVNTLLKSSPEVALNPKAVYSFVDQKKWDSVTPVLAQNQIQKELQSNMVTAQDKTKTTDERLDALVAAVNNLRGL